MALPPWVNSSDLQDAAALRPIPCLKTCPQIARQLRTPCRISQAKADEREQRLNLLWRVFHLQGDELIRFLITGM